MSANPPLEAAAGDPHSSIADILATYVGQPIGINVERADRIDEAQLIRVRTDDFTIASRNILTSLPFRSILSLSESPSGNVRVDGKAFALVVRVDHLIVYKGGIGVGLAVPMG